MEPSKIKALKMETNGSSGYNWVHNPFIDPFENREKKRNIKKIAQKNYKAKSQAKKKNGIIKSQSDS